MIWITNKPNLGGRRLETAPRSQITCFALLVSRNTTGYPNTINTYAGCIPSLGVYFILASRSIKPIMFEIVGILEDQALFLLLNKKSTSRARPTPIKSP
jgi:hypothetical protein